MSQTVNLGLIKAIFVGTTEPTNTNVIWRDTSLATPQNKYYNETTQAWEEFIYSTLIDNVTIKKNGSNQLYVDTNKIPPIVIADGSIYLAKIQNVGTETVFYRKSAGDGPPEVQALATLKTDLGLQGINTGDQDLSNLVPDSRTINTKPLTSDIVLSPSDIGSPAGSGTSTGTNTGDETPATILSKLGATTVTGSNTGDQNASQVPITDVANNFISTDVEGALAELASQTADLSNIERSYSITLPAYTSVASRVLNAVEGTDYPTGWTLAVGTSEFDLDITHNLNRNVVNITIFEVNVDGTERLLPQFSSAFTGVLQQDKNIVTIEGLTQKSSIIRINIDFL